MQRLHSPLQGTGSSGNGVNSGTEAGGSDALAAVDLRAGAREEGRRDGEAEMWRSELAALRSRQQALEARMGLVNNWV